MARSDYVNDEIINHILAALTPANRLAILTSLYTGLRISDVLNLRTQALSERLTVRESKTGKNRRITMPKQLVDDLLAQSGKIYVFESRTNYRKHRTRQAVYKDIKRACKAFRITKRLQISPHSARKIYAVKAYGKSDIRTVQKLLQHDSEAVTLIYALADELTARKLKH